MKRIKSYVYDKQLLQLVICLLVIVISCLFKIKYKIDLFEIIYIVLGFISGGQIVDYYKKLYLENYLNKSAMKYKDYLIFNKNEVVNFYRYDYYKSVLENYKKIIDDVYKDCEKNGYHSSLIEIENELMMLTYNRMNCINRYSIDFAKKIISHKYGNYSYIYDDVRKILYDYNTNKTILEPEINDYFNRIRAQVSDIIQLHWNQEITFLQKQTSIENDDDWRKGIKFIPIEVEGVLIEEDFKEYAENWVTSSNKIKRKLFNFVQT